LGKIQYGELAVMDEGRGVVGTSGLDWVGKKSEVEVFPVDHDLCPPFSTLLIPTDSPVARGVATGQRPVVALLGEDIFRSLAALSCSVGDASYALAVIWVLGRPVRVFEIVFVSLGAVGNGLN
jgi:hypothetical protein